MVYNEREERHEHLLSVGRQMMTAARTAPKGKGVDIIEIAMVDGDEDRERIASMMESLSEQMELKFFLRDAINIRQCELVIFIGTRSQPQGLDCGHCGFGTCAGRSAGVPCAINTIDCGIAIGSACATAADLRVDSRVMFSAGLAAQRLGICGEGVEQVMAIALSASSKSPFFDRITKK